MGGSWVKKTIYSTYRKTGIADAALFVRGNGLSILTYHGVCEDKEAAQLWVSPNFVRVSEFEQQLKYIKTRFTPLPLDEAVDLLQKDRLPKRAVALTFDDGYANNLHLAAPLLDQHHVFATIFLATDYIDTGELFHFDRLRLIRLAKLPRAFSCDHKRVPIEVIHQFLNETWGQVKATVTPVQRETLRPLSAAEIRVLLKSAYIQFGAHTLNHCILANETSERRRKEIVESLRRVTELTGNSRPLFSYPNGSQRDFGEQDIELLRQVTTAAVSVISGMNRKGTNPFALRRYPVTMGHDMDSFVAEVSGLRTLFRSLWP